MAREFSKKFYNSKEWKKCRDSYFCYRHGLCERCGQPGKIVHHKVYISEKNIDNPEITLCFENLELLCQDCHNAEHLVQDDYGVLREGLCFDEHGDIVQAPPSEAVSPGGARPHVNFSVTRRRSP